VIKIREVIKIKEEIEIREVNKIKEVLKIKEVIKNKEMIKIKEMIKMKEEHDCTYDCLYCTSVLTRCCSYSLFCTLQCHGAASPLKIIKKVKPQNLHKQFSHI
jgi:hypothetical protein